MKVSSIFILISLFAIIESDLSGFTVKNCNQYFKCIYPDCQAYSRSFCRSLALNEGDTQCCYLKYKNTTDEKTYYNCAPLTISQFYDIDAAIKNLEEYNPMDVKSLECTSSSYLYGSFLLLLFILF